VTAAAPDDDGLHRKLTRSIGWVVLERWGSRLLSLAVFMVLARFVAPELFGTVVLATSIVAVFQVLVEAGYPKALVQAESLDDADASTAFWAAIFLSLIAFLILFFAAPVVAVWLGDEELEPVLRALAGTLPVLAVSQTPAALLERDLDFRPLSVRQLVAAFVGAAVAIPLAVAGFGMWALVAQAIVSAVVAAVVLWFSISWRPRLQFSIRSLRRLSPIAGGVLGAQLLDAMQANLDKIVIGIFFDPAILAYYFLAQRLVVILTELVATVVSRVALPTFSRVQGDLDRLNRILRHMMFAAGILGVPAFGFCALFSPQLIPALFGPGWEPAVPLLAGLAIAGIFTTMMYFDRSALLATAHAREMFSLVLVQNVVSTLLLFALLPLGMLGVVISQWARVITWPLRLIVMRRSIELPVGKYLLQVARVVLPFILVAAIGVMLQLSAWADAPMAILSFAVPAGILLLAIYLGVVWKIAGSENRDMLRPLLRSVRSILRGGRGSGNSS
jgi:teichuronic acid exporter